MYYAGFAVILVKKNMIVIGKHYSLIRLVQALFQLSRSYPIRTVRTCPSLGL